MEIVSKKGRPLLDGLSLDCQKVSGLERVAYAKAEFVGIRRHADLKFLTVNSLVVFMVAKAHKTIGQIRRQVVGDGVGNTRASIPGEYGVGFIIAVAKARGVHFVFTLDEPHTNPTTDIRREGRVIMEIPIGVQEKGLQIPLPL